MFAWLPCCLRAEVRISSHPGFFRFSSYPGSSRISSSSCFHRPATSISHLLYSARICPASPNDLPRSRVSIQSRVGLTPTPNADIMIVALDNCRSTTDLGVFDCSRHAILDRLTCTLYSLYGCLLPSHLTPPSRPRVEVDPLIDFTASLNIKHSLHTSPDIANTYYRILMCP